MVNDFAAKLMECAWILDSPFNLLKEYKKEKKCQFVVERRAYLPQ